MALKKATTKKSYSKEVRKESKNNERKITLGFPVVEWNSAKVVYSDIKETSNSSLATYFLMFEKKTKNDKIFAQTIKAVQYDTDEAFERGDIVDLKGYISVNTYTNKQGEEIKEFYIVIESIEESLLTF